MIMRLMNKMVDRAGKILYRSCRGFTLTELLVALAVLSIVIAAFSALFGSSVTSLFSSGRTGNTLYSGQDNIENMIAHNEPGASVTLEMTFVDTEGGNADPVSVRVDGKMLTYGNLSVFLGD